MWTQYFLAAFVLDLFLEFIKLLTSKPLNFIEGIFISLIGHCLATILLILIRFHF